MFAGPEVVGQEKPIRLDRMRDPLRHSRFQQLSKRYKERNWSLGVRGSIVVLIRLLERYNLGVPPLSGQCTVL